MRIYYSSKFEREYKKLPNRIKHRAEEKENLFRVDPYNPSLQTHKLKGKLKGYNAFWIDKKYRIIFDFFNDDVVWFHSVGDHSIYK